MTTLTYVSLQFDGIDQYLEDTVRQAMGISNLWTISLWLKPEETITRFDDQGRQLFRPDGKALLHMKGVAHNNEILIWGDRVEDSTTEEFIVVENWDGAHDRLRITRFNLAQKRKEWRMFSCAWDGDNLIAWYNGQELTDYSTITGTGSAVMLDPDDSHDARSIRIAAAYSGIATTIDGPRVVAFSGALGPVGIWDSVLEAEELKEISSGTFGFDLSSNSGDYTSSASLQHWWRLGADETDVGQDYAPAGSINVGDDATVSGTSVAIDSPTPLITDTQSFDPLAAGGTLGDHDNIAVGISNNWTVSLWAMLNVSPIAGNRGLIGITPNTGASSTDEIGIFMSGTIQLNVLIRDPAVAVIKRWQSYPVSPYYFTNQGEWYLITATWDGTNLRVYRDDTDVTSQGAWINNNTGTMTDSIRRIAVGASRTFESAAFFDGRIYNLAIWDAVLAPKEIAAIYHGGLGQADLSQNFGNYYSSENLVHWWRLGEDSSNIGKDYVGTRHLDSSPYPAGPEDFSTNYPT